MSWVELHCIPAAWEEPHTGALLLEGFEREVGRPAVALLTAVASTQGGEPHSSAMNRLATYAPTHMLPHLGMPFTRQVLQLMGANIAPVCSAELREECWFAGCW